jgi:hypothetical protein
LPIRVLRKSLGQLWPDGQLEKIGNVHPESTRSRTSPAAPSLRTNVAELDRGDIINIYTNNLKVKIYNHV